MALSHSLVPKESLYCDARDASSQRSLAVVFMDTLAIPQTVPSLTHGPYHALVSQTRDAMGEHGALGKTLPATFASQRSLNQRFELIAEEWDLDSVWGNEVTFRMVWIQGQNTQILNCWGFPKYPSQMPVFAAELIHVGPQTRIAFIDLQAPVPLREDCTGLHKSLKALHEQYSGLPQAEPPPEWAIEASLGYFTFARQANGEETQKIRDAYLKYLDSFLRFRQTNHPRDCFHEQGHHEAIARLHAYQNHHMESSPGKQFLGKLFGEAWTNDFLMNFLFAQPGREACPLRN